MKQTFRVGGRGGGLVAAAQPEVLVEPEEELVSAAVEPVAETRRERLRFLRREQRAPVERPALPPRFASRTEALTAAVEALVASSPMTQLTAAHDKTLSSLRDLFEKVGSEEELELLRARVGQNEALATRALDVLADFAGRKQEPPQVDVHLPEQRVDVHVPETTVNVHVPEQAPPHVLVAAPEVTVKAPEMPTIQVNVPEGPAPVVNVQNDVSVEVPRPKPIRVEELSDGTRRYVPEEE